MNQAEKAKDLARAVAALKKVQDSPAWGRASAYVIIGNDPDRPGIIRIAYPVDGMGPLHLFVWDTEGSGLQYSRVSGCGFDKIAAGLNGMVFDGIKLIEDNVYQLSKHGYKVVRAL